MRQNGFSDAAETDIAAHEAWFAAYAAREKSQEHTDATPLDLKHEHTLAVLDNARSIAREESLSPAIARACLLAALYHDLGRFEQYLRYRTFRDKDSCNHGLLGVRILKKEGRLTSERPELRRLVMAAVGLHNRFALPAHLPATTAIVAKVVRDADKLDILRIMASHLSGHGPYNPTVVLQQPDDPHLASEAVIAAVREGRTAAYADLCCVNDFRLLLASWVYDLYFSASRRKFLRDGYARQLLQGIPDSAPHSAVRDDMLRRMLALQ